MCERAVLTNRPSLDLSPIVLEGRKSLSGSVGQRGLVEMICPTGKTKYFLAEDWTLESLLIPQANFSSTRNRDHAEVAASIMRTSIARLGKAHSMMIGSIRANSCLHGPWYGPPTRRGPVCEDSPQPRRCAVSNSNDEQKRALECLRLASDLMQLSKETLNPNLKAHCLRMAGVWTHQAAPGPTRDPASTNHLVH